MATHHLHVVEPWTHSFEEDLGQDYDRLSFPGDMALSYTPRTLSMGRQMEFLGNGTQDFCNTERTPYDDLLHLPLDKLVASPPPRMSHHVGFSLGTESPFPLPSGLQRFSSPVATSSSRSQSASPQEDGVAIQYPQLAYGSPPASDCGYHMPYPDCYSHDRGAPGGLRGGALSFIALRDVQGFADQMPDNGAEEAPKPYVKVECEVPELNMEIELPSTDLFGDDDAGPVGTNTDAEAVHWCKHDASESDADYKPPKASGRTRRERKRTFSQSTGDASSPKRARKTAPRAHTSSGVSSSEGHNKKRSRRSKGKAVHPSKHSTGGTMARPFSCPLAIYGCLADFVSKNEWKRHVSTQHIQIGFWRCDLCPASHDSSNTAIYYNDFKRKDLFTQHLRRMHASNPDSAHGSGSESGYLPVNEDTLPQHQHRCFRTLRSTPTASSCLFCPKDFSGPQSWEERMEHVGHHFEKDGKGAVLPQQWREDLSLQQYLLEEGLIERNGTSGWRLGDGVPRRTTGQKPEDDITDDDADADADADADVDVDADADADGEHEVYE